MFKKLILMLIVLNIYALAYSKGSSGIKYYQNYSMADGKFSSEIKYTQLKDQDKYFKVFYSVTNEIIKAYKYERGIFTLYILFGDKANMAYYLSYIYSNNKISRIEMFNRDQALLNYQKNYYNPENGHLDKIIFYNSQRKEIGERHYFYDLKGKVIKLQVIMTGKLLYERIFQYDKQGQLIYTTRPDYITQFDHDNPDHIIWVYLEILGYPEKSTYILKKYGINSHDKVEKYFKHLADLSVKRGFNERLMALRETRNKLYTQDIIKSAPDTSKEEITKETTKNTIDKPVNHWVDKRKTTKAMEIYPVVKPFDSEERILPYVKKDFILQLDYITDSIEEVVKNYNKLMKGETNQYHKSLTEFTKRMKSFQKMMNRTKFNESFKSVFEYYASSYPQNLKEFIRATQEAGELFRHKKPKLEKKDADDIHKINKKINAFINAHNEMVRLINEE